MEPVQQKTDAGYLYTIMSVASVSILSVHQLDCSRPVFCRHRLERRKRSHNLDLFDHLDYSPIILSNFPITLCTASITVWTSSIIVSTARSLSI